MNADPHPSDEAVRARAEELASLALNIARVLDEVDLPRWSAELRERAQRVMLALGLDAAGRIVESKHPMKTPEELLASAQYDGDADGAKRAAAVVAMWRESGAEFHEPVVAGVALSTPVVVHGISEAERVADAMREKVLAARRFARLVGQVMRVHRVDQKLDLAEMARHVGLSASGWSRVETGETVATVAQLRRAAQVLGIRASDIVRQAEALASKGRDS